MSDYVFTGFGPFLDYDYNPSLDVARALAEHFEGRFFELDVSFDAARDAFVKCGGTDGVTLVHLGLAAKRDCLGIERFAHNVRGERDDLPEQVTPDHGPLIEGAPLAYQTSIKVGEWVTHYERIRAEMASGEPEAPEARVSRDAGTYVCNAVYYHSLHGARDCSGVDILFIHLPELSPDHAPRVARIIAQTFERYSGDELVA